mmetsp:Transcript_26604/g.48745  ORF Transcript_26604/g.48745 Transcript_26604/m.48745 type:complete len:445 (+) Transcript_26604:149-1483(+)
MAAAPPAGVMLPVAHEGPGDHDETDVAADDTVPRQIVGTIYEYGSVQHQNGDQVQSVVQSGEYFRVLHDKPAQHDADLEDFTMSADGDMVSPHMSDDDSIDALSAGGTSEDEGMHRTNLPLARQTPSHEFCATVRTSDDQSPGGADAWQSKGGVPCVPSVSLRQKSQRKKGSTAKQSTSQKLASDGERARAVKEEEMWLARKQLTGVVARMVSYAPGEKLSDDILSLQRTPNGDLMVVSLCPDGPASMAGIVRGDKLVSINGRRTPSNVKEDVILAGLRGPMTLVFLGFVGKIQAEVQVAQPDAPSCGLSEKVDVAGVVPLPPTASVYQHDTVVFQQTEDTLILEKTAVLAEEAETRMRFGSSVMYQLQREDAQNILRQALAPTGALDTMTMPVALEPVRSPQRRSGHCGESPVTQDAETLDDSADGLLPVPDATRPKTPVFFI